ncbi:hypothetical protein GXP65_04460 [Vibrio campbellii]|uniref:CS1-pili formation C-terminal domain-containing protein n=1 Tax=Vibrio sp. LB10LO1 TaxID=2711207 RepID=UPI001389873F|nr:CS1-pili formation C-terminal domain-containing protein [Vibrio sp. LB10LO1]NDJ80265.1 hypothetical protein [Vibrio sp. LB10LO1]
MKKLLLVLMILLTRIAFANVPEGFEDLFEQKEANINIVINDDAQYRASGFLGLGSTTLAMTDEMKVELNELLKSQYVKSSAAKAIISDLTFGITDSPHCLGRRTTCQLSDTTPEEVQYVVVNEEQTLRILVPDSLMSQEQESQRYVSETRGENAIIIHHDLSMNSNIGSSSEIYYNNETTIGLLGGFIHSDLNVSTTDENFKEQKVYFDELAFHYLEENQHIKVGFSSENMPRAWNSTSMLDADEDISVIEVSTGTTSELEYRDNENQPRIYFSIPQSGRLFVYREDGTPVIERNVPAGQNYISYSDLPSGIEVYNILVNAGNNEIYNKFHKVYNNNGSKLDVGNWDYFITAGSLKKQEIIANEQLKPLVDDYEYNVFLEARTVTQINSDVAFGVGLLNTRDDYFAKLALNYNPSSNISFNSLYGIFDDGTHYLQSNLSLYGMNFSASQFHDRTVVADKISFANYLYGYGSKKEVSASYGRSIGFGRAYVSYSRIVNEGLESMVFENIDQIYSSYESMTAGYSFSSWFNSTVDLQLSLSDEVDINGGTYDNWSILASVSIPLSSSGYSSFSTNIFEGSQQYTGSIGNSYQLSENASMNIEAGTTYSDNAQDDNKVNYYGSTSGNYKNKYIDGNAFAYVDSHSSNISGSLSSTTLITNDGIKQTRSKSDSYLVINNENNAKLSDTNKGDQAFLATANLKANGTHTGRILLDHKEVVYPLDQYLDYQIALDEDASDYHNLGRSKYQATSYPGTVMNLDVDLREVKSYISIFNDIEGNPIDLVECLGTGCVSVEQITDGVFKFRISSGLPFELRTSAQRCLIPSPDEFSTQNLGKNFCMPNFEEEGQFRITRGDSGNYYYYVGEFNDMDIIESYETSLNDSSLKFVKQTVGTRTFLFVESPSLLALNQQEAIESLSQYALEETLDRPMLVSR